MDSYGWKTKTWKLSDGEKMKAWIKKWSHKYQIREIFVNNAYAVEYKLLLHF